MRRTKVLSIQRISAEDRAKIEAVDPAIQLTDAGGWYDGEIRESWPAFTSGQTAAGPRSDRRIGLVSTANRSFLAGIWKQGFGLVYLMSSRL
jgi:hypothetical protein